MESDQNDLLIKPKTEEEKQPFAKPDHLCDIVLVVEENKLHFNKAMLAACSPVFDRMFYGNFAEAMAEEIPLPGKKLDVMVIFLQLIHPAHSFTTDVTDNYLLNLLCLAKEYQVETIRVRCEQYITIETERGQLEMSTDRVLLYLYACDKYSLLKPLAQLKSVAERTHSSRFTGSKMQSMILTPSCVDALLTARAKAENVSKEMIGVIDSISHFLGSSSTVANGIYPNNLKVKLEKIRHEIENCGLTTNNDQNRFGLFYR